MPRYNHAVFIGFEVISDTPNGTDFTPAMLNTALALRMSRLNASPDRQEWIEAVGNPYDTFVIEEPEETQTNATTSQ